MPKTADICGDGAALWQPSPNCGARRDGALPDMVVLHYTAMETAEAALTRLCLAEAEVSAHYLISAQGKVWQMVDESARAWHAGAGQWGDVTDVNSRSIGIELANSGVEPFSAPQMTALTELLRGILARHNIQPARVIAHSDMAPARKSDPGRRFDWRYLARLGLSVWPEEGGEARVEDFFKDAAAFGYALPECEAPQDAILDAFRRRFRPWASGPLSAKDAAAMCDLARRYAL